jgi:hypothetical protein
LDCLYLPTFLYILSTPNEKKILQNPHELEGGYAAYDDRASTVSAGNAASKV